MQESNDAPRNLETIDSASPLHDALAATVDHALICQRRHRCAVSILACANPKSGWDRCFVLDGIQSIGHWVGERRRHHCAPLDVVGSQWLLAVPGAGHALGRGDPDLSTGRGFICWWRRFVPI